MSTRWFARGIIEAMREDVSRANITELIQELRRCLMTVNIAQTASCLQRHGKQGTVFLTATRLKSLVKKRKTPPTLWTNQFVSGVTAWSGVGGGETHPEARNSSNRSSASRKLTPHKNASGLRRRTKWTASSTPLARPTCIR